MKLSIASQLVDAGARRRLPKGHHARMRAAHVEAVRRVADAIPLAPWTPPIIVRVRARMGSI